MSWSVFYHPRRTGHAATIGVLVPMECRTTLFEEEAKLITRQLIDAGFRGVAVRPPNSLKYMTPMQLRTWLRTAADREAAAADIGRE
jgi:hypothetical protein